MTTALSIVIAGLSLCFGVVSALLAVMVRVIVRYTKNESKIDGLATDLKEIAVEMKADRDATDKRLRYLEEWHMRHSV